MDNSSNNDVTLFEVVAVAGRCSAPLALLVLSIMHSRNLIRLLDAVSIISSQGSRCKSPIGDSSNDRMRRVLKKRSRTGPGKRSRNVGCGCCAQFLLLLLLLLWSSESQRCALIAQAVLPLPPQQPICDTVRFMSCRISRTRTCAFMNRSLPSTLRNATERLRFALSANRRFNLVIRIVCNRASNVDTSAYRRPDRASAL